MARLLTIGLLAALIAGATWRLSARHGNAEATSHRVGTSATRAQIAAKDINVFPDGRGLPTGRGTAKQGREIFAARCAACHGMRGEGVQDFPRLAGGRGTLTTGTPVLTVGSYWPYATTLWDYNRRAMPYQQPGNLTIDEVYAVTAYVLHLSNIVDEDAVLDERTLPLIKMPNRGGFVTDPRGPGRR